MSQDNPFAVLRLDPAATEEEIVRQAGRLRQRATDAAAQTAILQAVQKLTASGDERLLHSLLAHPRPCYHWPALERLAADHRRPPAASMPPPCPPLDLEELLGLLRQSAAAELEPAPVPFEDVPGDEPAEEISRQSDEILFQSLLFDPRG
jgi:hypothetical protein